MNCVQCNPFPSTLSWEEAQGTVDPPPLQSPPPIPITPLQHSKQVVWGGGEYTQFFFNACAIRTLKIYPVSCIQIRTFIPQKDRSTDVLSACLCLEIHTGLPRKREQITQ